jgi:hypothetical protein
MNAVACTITVQSCWLLLSAKFTMSAELSDQTCRRSAGCYGDDMSSALTGELNRHRADGTGSTEDQHGVPPPQPERVDALECSQPRCGNRSGIAQIARTATAEC